MKLLKWSLKPESDVLSANKSHLRILSDIPRSLQGLWSSCVTSTIMKLAAAKAELESFLALKCWAKLKGLHVMPLKAVKQCKNSTHKFHKKRMLRWLAEQYKCWQIATTIEQTRQKKFKKKNDQKQNKEINQKRESLKLKLSNEPKPAGTDLTMEERQMYWRAKNYVNVSEHY